MDENSQLIDFANKLENVCVDTVQNGSMTKDLAILISKHQEYLNTEDFLAKIDSNLQTAIS